MSAIKIGTYLSSPINERQVPELEFRFFNRKSHVESKMFSNLLLQVRASDAQCTGEYSLDLDYQPTPRIIDKHYFSNSSPWPEEIDIILSVDSGDRKKLLISFDDESKSFRIIKKIKYLLVVVNNGQADLKIEISK